MAITTLSNVKAVCDIGYADSSQDAAIGLYIDKVEGDYLQIRNAPFQTDEEGVIIYPGEAGAEDSEKSAVIAAEMVGYQLELGRFEGRGLKSESLGDLAQSFEDKLMGYPKDLIAGITRYAGAK